MAPMPDTWQDADLPIRIPADLGDQGLGLSHSTSISALTPMSTTPGGSTHEATPESDNSQYQASDDQSNA